LTWGTSTALKRQRIERSRGRRGIKRVNLLDRSEDFLAGICVFFPFEAEMGEVLSPKRAAKYRSWVELSVRAGEMGDTSSVANQMDKAEEMMTWVTFAPLLRMGHETRKEVVSEIVGVDFCQVARPRFEAVLRPPKRYLEQLRESVDSHPVRYIREQARDRIARGRPLEGPTHVDCVITASSSDERSSIIGVEAKMISDISTHTRFDPTRNQLARIVDVLLEREEQDVYVLLVVPSLFLSRPGARLYGYKARECDQSKMDVDLPHRREEELGRVRAVSCLSWSEVARGIWRRAREECIVTGEEVGWAKRFYFERREAI